MNNALTCPQCGSSLSGTGLTDSYCPTCLLREGLLDSAGEPDSPAPRREPPVPRLFGPYELLEVVGRGGGGVVYRSRQRSLNRTVAIKLLAAGVDSSEASVRRFQIEAESAAALQHPGIVAIHECGQQDDQPYYAMEFVPGRNLADVSGGKPLEARRAARYLRAVAEAVHYAHRRGILHRDLKPSNVLIDQDDRPRITDFGLARQVDGRTEMTLAGQILGSPNYSSPEQLAGRREEVGVGSDLYSLGAMLYHLLTGRPPFLAGTVQETLRLVHEEEPVSPRALNPTVPADLETICLKCLEKSPGKRYGSASELAEELRRFLDGEPIQARPITPVERGWRWCRRHPAVASLAATVIVALSGTALLFYVSARRIEHARQQEQAAREEAEVHLYAANMQVVSRGFNTPLGVDPEGSRVILERARPRAGQPDIRGFEWRYFWRETAGDAVATLAGHKHVVDAAVFSPDGALVATHSLDGVLKVWDAHAGLERHALDGVARLGGFTPAGRLIYSQPDDSLWELDPSSGRTSRVLPPSGQLVAVLPDGLQAVVIGADALPVARKLGAAEDQERGVKLPLEACVVVSADGRRAAVSSPPGRPYPGLLVVDLQTREQVAALVDPRPVIGLALSPDGKRLVSSGFDGILKVWDVDRGVQTHAFKAFIDPVWGLAFSHDGRTFAAAGNNREIGLWETATWEPLHRVRGHRSTVRTLSFSADGQRVVSGGEDDLALVFSVRPMRPPDEAKRLLRGPAWIDRTPALVFSPDSRLFAGTAADGTVKVWTTDTLEPVARFPMEARTVAFGPDGRSVLTEGYNGEIRRWSLVGDEPSQLLAPAARFANWQVDVLSAQERVALVAEQAATRAQCRLAEIPSARDGINAGAITTTPTLALTPDGKTMFIGQPSGEIEEWDIATRQRRRGFPAHKLNVTALVVSPDGRYLASGSLDNSTRLWDVATGERLATFLVHNRSVWALAFSPDSQTLAAGSCDKEIILFSVPLRMQVAGLPLYVGTPAGYEQEVRLLRFSPDGNLLASALGDGTVRFFRATAFAVADGP